MLIIGILAILLFFFGLAAYVERNEGLYIATFVTGAALVIALFLLAIGQFQSVNKKQYDYVKAMLVIAKEADKEITMRLLLIDKIQTLDSQIEEARWGNDTILDIWYSDEKATWETFGLLPSEDKVGVECSKCEK